MKYHSFNLFQGVYFIPLSLRISTRRPRGAQSTDCVNLNSLTWRLTRSVKKGLLYFCGIVRPFKQTGCNLIVYRERKICCQTKAKRKTGFTVCSIDVLISIGEDSRIFVAEFKGNGNFEIKPAFTSCLHCVDDASHKEILESKFHEHFEESVEFRKTQTQVDRDCTKLIAKWNTDRVLPKYCRLYCDIWDNGVWKQAGQRMLHSF